MIVARAPLRIPLGGGGTDLSSYYSKYGGFILSASINKYVFINLNKPQIDRAIILKYSKSEIINDVNGIQHPLFREALKLVGVDSFIEIASLADVPAGTGLGSSGSFLVCLLAALHAFKRKHISTRVLAEEACRIEMDILGDPVGKHDQYMAAFGGLTYLDIDRNGEVSLGRLRISSHDLEELKNGILLFYTGIRRKSSTVLQEQRKDSQRGEQRVIESLHRTKEIGYQIKRALEEGNLRRFGELLDAHWHTKKIRSGKISNPNIDRWYEVARKKGALGGKIMGAGGGGFFMFYCPNDRKASLRAAMTREGLREMSFDFDFEGVKVLVNF